MEVIGGLYHKHGPFPGIYAEIGKHVWMKDLAAHGVKDDVDAADRDPDAVSKRHNALAKALNRLPQNAAHRDPGVKGIATCARHLSPEAKLQLGAFAR